MPQKGTVNGIFVVPQMAEKHKAKVVNLCYAFVDLEKAFDRVPKEVVRWALRKLGAEQWLVKAVSTPRNRSKLILDHVIRLSLK